MNTMRVGVEDGKSLVSVDAAGLFDGVLKTLIASGAAHRADGMRVCSTCLPCLETGRIKHPHFALRIVRQAVPRVGARP
ncbi:hypothetical protein, partial [Stenotrophomonas sp. HMWF003]|uniref:hypothetical protein n=1 Tax=Stenotrophomonas sp. HMWF003 TaxID=2056840 RepID=UPI001C637B8C